MKPAPCVSFLKPALLLALGQMATSAVMGQTLADALDLPELEFEAFFQDHAGIEGAWQGQTEVTADGVDAARTAPTPHWTSELRTTTNIMGPKVVRFQRRSDHDDFQARFSFFFGDYRFFQDLRSTEGFEEEVVTLPAGEHPLRWTFLPMNDDLPGVAYLDQLSLEDVPAGQNARFLQSPEPRVQALAGEPFQLQVYVTGTPPLAFEWTKDGQPIADNTGPQVDFGTLALEDSGVFDVTATSATGVRVSHQDTTLTVLDPDPVALADAVDHPSLTFRVDAGDTPWGRQIVNTADGVDAAEAVIPPDLFQEASMTTVIEGPTKLRFLVKYLTEETEAFFELEDNGQLRIQEDGDSGGFVERFVGLGEGSHEITWRYRKVVSFLQGQEVIVDQVETLPFGEGPPAFSEEPPAFADAYAGDEIVLSALPVDADFLQWQKDGVDLPGQMATTLTLPAVQAGDSGTYQLVATNAAGSTTSRGVDVRVWNLDEVPAVLDAPDLTFSLSGAGQWFPQRSVVNSGESAMQAPALGHGEHADMGTTVTGPSLLTFRWKTRSEPRYDRLILMIDGEEVKSLSGDGRNFFRSERFGLGPGEHTVVWRYTKDGGNAFFEDTAWLDNVEIREGFGNMPPEIVFQPIDQVVQPGGTLTLEVILPSGGSDPPASPLTIQWRRDGVAIPGANTETLQIPHADPAQHNGAYTVVISNANGSVTSEPAQVSVEDDPFQRLAEIQRLPTSQHLEAVICPSEGTLLALGQSVVVTSTNGGTSWTAADPLFGEGLSGAAVAAGEIITVGASGGIFSSMDEGETWMRQIPPSSELLADIAVNDQRFVAVGGNHTILTRERDADDWIKRHVPQEEHFFFGVTATNEGGFVAVGRQGGGQGGLVAVSPDGTTWSLIDPDIPGTLNDVCQLPHGRMLAVGDGGKVVLFDANGDNVEVGSTPVETALFACVLADSGIYLAGVGSMVLHSADQGTTWNLQNVGSGPYFLDGKAAHGWITLVGAAGEIVQKPDQPDGAWVSRSSGASSPIIDVEIVPETGALALNAEGQLFFNGVEIDVPPPSARGMAEENVQRRDRTTDPKMVEIVVNPNLPSGVPLGPDHLLGTVVFDDLRTVDIFGDLSTFSTDNSHNNLDGLLGDPYGDPNQDPMALYDLSAGRSPRLYFHYGDTVVGGSSADGFADITSDIDPAANPTFAGMSEAPNGAPWLWATDGSTYANQEGAWTQVVAPNTLYDPVLDPAANVVAGDGATMMNTHSGRRFIADDSGGPWTELATHWSTSHDYATVPPVYQGQKPGDPTGLFVQLTSLQGANQWDETGLASHTGSTRKNPLYYTSASQYFSGLPTSKTPNQPSAIDTVDCTRVVGTPGGGVLISDDLPAPAPLTAKPDVFTLEEDSPPVTLDVLGNDLPSEGTPLGISGINDSPFMGADPIFTSGGTVQLTAGSSILYTPDENYFGTDTFTYTIEDTENPDHSSTATVTVNVQPINDGPEVAIPGGNLVTDEDDPLPLTQTPISVADVDADDNDVDVTLTVSHGRLDLPGGGVGMEGNGSGRVILTGTVSQINDALAGLHYTPQENASGTEILTVTVDDGGHTGGVSGDPEATNPLSVTEEISITINPVNDAPVNTVPGPQTVFNDGSETRFEANSFGVNDADAGTLSVTLSVGHGTIRIDANGDLSTEGNETPSLTMQGTVSDINAALDSLTYDPFDSFFGNDTLTITTSDLGGTGQGGTLTDEDSVSLLVEPPGRPFAAADTLMIPEDSGTHPVDLLSNDFNFHGMLGGEDLSITAINDLPITGDATTTTSERGGTISVTNGLVTYTPATDFFGIDTFTYTIESSPDPGDGPSSSTVNIEVTPVNDGPINEVPPSFDAKEDTDLVFANGSEIQITDVDAGDSHDVLVTLEVGNGQFTINNGGDDGANVEGSGSNKILLSGTVTQVNESLANGGLTYTPPSEFFGDVPLTISTDDQGNTGGTPEDPGAPNPLTDVDTVNINVQPINDPPINEAPRSVSVEEDNDLVFGNDSSLKVADVDAGDDDDVLVTLEVGNGQLTLTGGVPGANVEGSGTHKILLDGSVTKVNHSLANGDLTFSPPADFFGEVSLTITTDDQGNTGGTLEDPTAPNPLTDVDTLLINVQPINDGPLLVVPGEQTFLTDFDNVLGPPFSASDVDAADNDVKVTLSLGEGSLSLTDADGALIVEKNGVRTENNGSGMLSLHGALDDINQLVTTETFSVRRAQPGMEPLTVEVDDLGSTGDGGPQRTTASIPLTFISNKPQQDSDGDGTTDAVERLLGFDPMNPHSNFSIRDAIIQGDDLTILFPNPPRAATFDIEVSTDGKTFEKWRTGIEPDGEGVLSVTLEGLVSETGVTLLRVAATVLDN